MTNAQPAREPKQTRTKPARSAAVKTRRRAQTIAAGIAVIVIGTLATYFVLQSQGKAETVFTTKVDLTRGQVIDSSQLAEIQIGSGQVVDAYTPAEVKQLVGQYATVDLPAGSLLTSKNTSTDLGVPDGQSLVGVPLKAGQFPASPLVAGDHVRLVASQALDASGRQVEDAGAAPVEAVVAGVKFDDIANLTVVDVFVPTGKAAELASRAAGGTLALVLDPAE